MSSFCHQEVERVTKVSVINCLLPHPPTPAHRLMVENLEFPKLRFLNLPPSHLSVSLQD